jgi:hypothetical protein
MDKNLKKENAKLRKSLTALDNENRDLSKWVSELLQYTEKDKESISLGNQIREILFNENEMLRAENNRLRRKLNIKRDAKGRFSTKKK